METKKENKMTFAKLWRLLLQYGVLISVVIIIVIKLILFGLLVKDRWEELVFAFNKPQIIRVVKEQYLERQTQLDQSFMKKEKTAEERFIEEVTTQLKESK